jgi:hypothetical protein
VDAGAAAGPADDAVTAVASSDAGAGSAAAVQPASAQPAAAAKEFVRPGIGRRLVRGLLWGAIYGQWWTLFAIISPFIWGHGSFDLGVTMLYLVVYGFFGSLTGLIIGAFNASMGTGVALGVGVGLLLCALEALLSRDSGALIKVIFYFFTGRFVGAGITWRVQQPVRRKVVLEGR